MISLLRKLVVKDFWLKLFSLALASLIWFTVNIAQRNTAASGPPFLPPRIDRRVLTLPVVIVCSADEVRNFRVYPKDVQVTVQGDPKVLQKLLDKEFRVLVDLTGIPAAQELRKRVEVSTPAGIALVRVDPREVQVVFPPRN